MPSFRRPLFPGPTFPQDPKVGADLRRPGRGRGILKLCADLRRPESESESGSESESESESESGSECEPKL